MESKFDSEREFMKSQLNAWFYHADVDISWQKTVKNGIMPAWNTLSTSLIAIGGAPSTKSGSQVQYDKHKIPDAALICKRGILIFQIPIYF